MHTAALLIGVLAAFLLLMAGAQRVRVPDPIVLVLGGVALALIPGLPDVELAPELVLLAFLPPLLYAEAYTTSWRDFRANLRPIALLAVGLVLVTTLAVAAVAHAILPGLPWAAAFALGAVLAPTDAVAALAVVSRLPVPQRIVTVLAGEALINDATALVAFQFAVGAALTGTFSATEAVGRFGMVAGGGVMLGLGLGAVLLEGLKLRIFDGDHKLENVALLLAPFAAYVAAEHLHLSGVLAVVACGMFVGRHHSRVLSPRARQTARALWELLSFVLNGLLFMLVGLQLQTIMGEPAGPSPLGLLDEGLLVAGIVVAVRVLWVYPATYLPRVLSRRIRRRDPSPAPRSVAIIAWTGMRGGISLAAALAIPTHLANGQPFPGRGAIIIITFVVLMATLIGQGLSLPLLIKALGLVPDGHHEREEAEARLRASEAAQGRFEALVEAGGVPDELEDGLRRRLADQTRRHCARHGLAPDAALEARNEALTHIRRELMAAERQAVIAMRDGGAISDEVLLHLEAEWDLEDLSLDETHA